MTSTYNTFQIQAQQYLGITGGTISSLQSLITTTAYTPSISGTSTITVNGSTGYYDNVGMTWGTIDATLLDTVASGSFTFTFPTSYYTQVPAVVYSVTGNDDVSACFVSGYDTQSGETTIVIKRDSTTGAADLKICWISQQQT